MYACTVTKSKNLFTSKYTSDEWITLWKFYNLSSKVKDLVIFQQRANFPRNYHRDK